MATETEKLSDTRSHPDVFTADEARAFLHLENVATLEWLRESGFLTGHRIGKAYMYHREDLDLCALKMFGKSVPSMGTGTRRQALKLAGGGA